MYYIFKYTSERKVNDNITIRVKASKYIDAEVKADRIAIDVIRTKPLIRKLLSISV